MPAVILLDPDTRQPVRILRGSDAHLPDHYAAALAGTAILYTESGEYVAVPIYETQPSGKRKAVGEGARIPTRPMSEVPAALDGVVADGGRLRPMRKAEKDARDAARANARKQTDDRQAREAAINAETRRRSVAGIVARGEWLTEWGTPE